MDARGHPEDDDNASAKRNTITNNFLRAIVVQVLWSFDLDEFAQDVRVPQTHGKTV